MTPDAPTTPPPRLEYGVNRRKSAFKRERLVSVLRIMVWVVPLTILIWIWAEREQVLYPNSPNVTNVPVTIRSDRMYVEPATPGRQTVNLKISGPQEAIDGVRESLSNGNNRGLVIDLGNSVAVGDGQPVNVVEHIQNMELFKKAGVTIEESQPGDLLVNVDQADRREVPVEVSPADQKKLTGPPVFSPPTVAVSGPKKLLDSAQLKVFAVLAGNSEMDVSGEHDFKSVPVQLPAGFERVRVAPAQVNARITVRSPNESFTIHDGIPIVISAPTSVTDSWKISILPDAAISDVTVTGPPEQIDLIRKGTFFVKAALDISNDDIARPEPKTLTYTLPEGVLPTEETKRRTVEFKAVKRPDGPG
jgi:YbbR domain-containing protein